MDWMRRRRVVASMRGMKMRPAYIRGLSLIMVSSCLLILPSHARAEFHLDTGDTIEISIAGIPELKTRATIDLDGNIMVPVVGVIPAAGASINGLLNRLRAAFADRAISVRGVDGRTVINPVASEDVSVTIAEYRPIYVSGDVLKAGEVAYRPGLTVRQAIAMAGSYDLARFRVNNPYIEAINYNTEYTMLSTELQHEEERKKLIYSELNLENEDKGKPVLSESGIRVQPSFIAEQFRAQDQDFERDIAHLRATTNRLDRRSSSLNEQKAKEEEGLKADLEDFERAKALLEKGTTSIQRVTDARRAMLLSATRALQTEAEAARASLEREEISRSVQKLQDQRRIRLLTELQDNAAKILRIQAQLKAAKEKLFMVGTLKSAWTDARKPRPQIIVHRGSGKQNEQINATEDTPLLPGDLIEVALPIDQ